MAIKQCLGIITCLLSASLAFPQQKLSGKVLDAGSGSPLASISVYLNNTSIGTTTTANGEFFLGHIPPAKYKLIVSGISFKTFSTIIDTHDSIAYMTIELTRAADLLKGTEINPPDPNGWSKWGQLFTNLFVGTSPHADECRILNHEVLKFRMNDDNTLSIYAEKPLQLHNAALGYDITYKIEDFTFDFSASVVAYSGSVLFKDLSLARSGSKALSWRQNRFTAYNGSLLHFMRSLYVNRLAAEGFEMHSLAKVFNRDKQRAKQLFAKQAKILDSTDYFKKVLMQPDSIISHQLVPEDSVAFAEDSMIAGFYFPDSLEVSYKLKEIPAAYRRLSPETRKETYPVSQFVFVNKAPIYVLGNGFHYGPNDLKITGYWAWSETIATLLPYDYEPGQ
jgi:hypothetical protein